MLFSTIIPPAAWIAGITAVLAIAYCAFPALNILRRTGLLRFAETPNGAELAASDTDCPKVSVIVYAFTGEDRLPEYLETLMSQDYPDFEVILIYEAGAEATAILADRFTPLYPSLYVTFLPPGSHNLSRRKLALTMGMKAAKGEIVVTTATNSIIPSRQWLSGLVAPFCRDKGIDVSLGVSRFDFDELSGPGKWYHQFDNVMTSSQWIASALRKRPYRGDGYNLAFRKSLFFENKGYSKTINLENGDDDLFVNDITDDKNTAVSVSPETILTMTWEDAANRMWKERKERYDFTSRWLPRRPFLSEGFVSFMRWIAPVCSTVAIMASLPNILPACVFVPLLVFAALMEISAYRNAATALQAVRLWWAVPLFMLWRPIGNFIFRISSYHHRRKNFTWQRSR